MPTANASWITAMRIWVIGGCYAEHRYRAPPVPLRVVAIG
jgi:hypothetical protein